MKKIFALILTAQLLCGMLAPSVLAAEESSSAYAETETTDTITDSGSGADTGGSLDTATPSDSGTATDSNETTGTGKSIDAPGETQHSSLPEGFDYTGCVIFYATPNAFNSIFNMDCGDTGFTQLHNALDSIGISGTVAKDANSYSFLMSVTWDFSTVDAGTPGNYTAIGTISVPEGATLSDGLENTISISIQVASPELIVSPSSITLTSFDEPDRTDAVAFAVGTTQEEISKWFADTVAGFTGYDADGNSYDLISGAWSLDAVNTSTTGVYYASTVPDLGTEYTAAQDVSLPRQLCAVSIQTPGEPDINCCVAARGFLRFPWKLSAKQQEQLNEFAIWLRQDGGEWTSLSDGFLFVSDGLQLSQRIFTYGSTYELKVTYPGGQTGVLSFQYDGELNILDYSGGDRDGGDAGGSDSGSGTQPPPITPQTPSESHDDNNHNISDNTPIHNDSSSESNETPQDSGSTTQEAQDSSSSETQPTPTAPQAPSDSQNNGDNNGDINSQIQVPVAEKPGSDTPAAQIESTVPMSSYTSLPHKKGSSSSEQENPAALKEDRTKAAPDETDTREKISEAHIPATFQESYSPTQTVISGLRLRDLCKDEETVVFGSGDLTVSIPSKLLLALNLSDSDTLSVRLIQPESNQIMLAVEVSGKMITELTETVLRLRYMPQAENSKITVLNEAGEQIKDSSYNGELLRFTAEAAGTYTILEQSNTNEAQKDISPLIPVSGGLLVVAGGITYFKRRRHE